MAKLDNLSGIEHKTDCDTKVKYMKQLERRITGMRGEPYDREQSVFENPQLTDFMNSLAIDAMPKFLVYEDKHKTMQFIASKDTDISKTMLTGEPIAELLGQETEDALAYADEENIQVHDIVCTIDHKHIHVYSVTCLK
jgi:hypothetical protein